MRFTVRGYTCSHPDFIDTLELPDDFDTTWLGGACGGDKRYSQTYTIFKRALLDTACPSEYLDVYDFADFEQREDLADYPGQIVLLAESLGCENCSEVGNDFMDGCDEDAPHGGFMITLDPLEPFDSDQSRGN